MKNFYKKDFRKTYSEWKELRGSKNFDLFLDQLLLELDEEKGLDNLHIGYVTFDNGIKLPVFNIPDEEGEDFTPAENGYIISYCIEKMTDIKTNVYLYSWKGRIDHVTIEFIDDYMLYPNIVVVFDAVYDIHYIESYIIHECINYFYFTVFGVDELKTEEWYKHKQYYCNEYDKICDSICEEDSLYYKTDWIRLRFIERENRIEKNWLISYDSDSCILKDYKDKWKYIDLKMKEYVDKIW